MTAKMIEVRDRSTFIPMLAILLDSDNDQAAWLLRQAGFRGPDHYVLLCKISGGSGHYKCTADPFDWGAHDRTYSSVHRWLEKHFDEVADGAVLDVEFLLKEKEV